MTKARLTKRAIDAIEPRATRFTVYDDRLPGFGLRVTPSGQKTWIVEYRAGGGGRRSPKRRLTLGLATVLTPDQARQKATEALASVRLGKDPAHERQEARHALTVADLANLFLTEHVELKRKPATIRNYRTVLRDHVLPHIGRLRAEAVHRSDVARIHVLMKDLPSQANRMLATVSSMFGFAQTRGLVPDDFNPARRIARYPEHGRERYLSTDELERLGTAMREAETVGIPWEVDEMQANAKHIPKLPENRKTILGIHATAAIRLLILTGARLREILHLKWEYVDFQRGVLLLPDSKTGRKTIQLSPPTTAVIRNLPRSSVYVIAGNDPAKPRHDLQRPWDLIRRRAGIEGVRLHDLRHTYASYGAASGLGLPIIGKLLGHREAATTQRYAHLDNDPLKRAAGSIGATIAQAMGEPHAGRVVEFHTRRTG